MNDEGMIYKVADGGQVVEVVNPASHSGCSAIRESDLISEELSDVKVPSRQP